MRITTKDDVADALIEHTLPWIKLAVGNPCEACYRDERDFLSCRLVWNGPEWPGMARHSASGANGLARVRFRRLAPPTTSGIRHRGGQLV